MAETQVTAEQILHEAYENRDRPLEKPKQNIQDLDELRSFQLNKRKEYEQQLNKNRLNFGQWVRYAKWEVSHNHDFARARSIYERALQVNIEHIPFWTHYIQLELSNKNVNHARNLLERAVTSLPRIDKFWFLYVQTEETLGNYLMVRTIFERWITWHPPVSAWDAYINFEKRYGEFDNVRQIFSRYVVASPGGETWLKWIKFELSSRDGGEYTRSVFESAIDTLISENKQGQKDGLDPQFGAIIDKWTIWETSMKEYERAREIYRLLLNGNIIEDKNNEIFQLYTEFEKTYGTKDDIESSIETKRKLQYRQELDRDPYDYDNWWAYLKLLDKEDEIVEAFERACSSRPKLIQSKTILWRRYVFLWIKYALWEEFDRKDVTKARQIWNQALKSVPKAFTFGKLWIMFAEFELRNGELASARKILGRSIGQHKKAKVFKYYISLERKLGEWERVRKIYEKYLEVTMTAETLLKYVEFERELDETERCEGLFELGLQPTLNIRHQELLWKEYIEYWKDELKFDRARETYRKLLMAVPHSAKVWISFAVFESGIPTKEQLLEYEESGLEELEFEITEVQRENTRKIFEEAYNSLKGHHEERVVIIEAWKDYEESQGTSMTVEEVNKKLPTMVTRRRVVNDKEEEYTDYIFPEDEAKKPSINKFLANAKKWMALQND